VRFLAGAPPSPHGIHSFAIWAVAGVLAARELNRRGIATTAVASAYGTRAHEVGAMQHGLQRHHGSAHRVRYRAWLRWIHAVDDRVEGWGYGRSGIVLVNYASVQRILERSYGLGGSIRRVPYASEDAFANGGLSASKAAGSPLPGHASPVVREPAGREPPLVLAVSRHDPRKGLDVLLLALAHLADDGVPFRACLVGPGRLLEAHRRLAGELGLADRVTIPGAVPDVRPYFDSADIFVLPSLAEASGSVSILEAMRAGTAVIASACDGIPEDLVDGTDALLVAPGDARALSVALGRLLADAELRARLAAAARQAHDRSFSAQGLVAALGDVYRDAGFL